MLVAAVRIRVLSRRLRPAGGVGEVKQVVVGDVDDRFRSRLPCKIIPSTSMSQRVTDDT